jgi:hypothetical protein
MRRALVIGCSVNVWADVEDAQALGTYEAVYCVKLAGVHWKGGRFVWATLHPEFMDQYEAERKAHGRHAEYEIVAPLANEVGMHGSKGNIARRISYRYPGMNSSASSGLYAAKVALDDGCDRVVLAGVPMQQDANHFTRGKPWLQVNAFTNGFERSVPHMQGKVRSMSGLTRDVLGRPTSDWLA